ncbi:MAG: hypothetical protein HN404_09855 [Gemmatimonadetes bacterium]|jgi:hypothetical protein|nr:hypothetical protein [Gemmatimonadota bacterium]
MRHHGHGQRRLHLKQILLVGITLSGLLGAHAPAAAQFMSRDFRELWANEVFENYGPGGYRDYDFGEENRRFDLFGDLIVDGVDIVQVEEVRRDRPGLRGSFEQRNGRYDRFFDKLVIANEGFGPWSTRLIIGDHISTHFTPMTLNMPRFNGIRWDGASSSNRFSIIASHLTDPVVVPNNADIETDFDRRRIFGTSAFGGHWESQIGGALRIGTTYVNTHRFDSEAGTDLNGMRGTVPRVMHGGLRKVYVFVTDDNPEDDTPGAAIHELTMLADGERVEPLRVAQIDHLLQKVPVTPDLTSTVLLKANEISFLRQNGPWLQSVIDASNTPFFKAIIGSITRPVSGATLSHPLRADGDNVVVYEYEVSDTTRALQFEAVVSDDYSIDIAGAMNVPVLASRADDFYFDWQNAARAAGAPAGGANLKRIRFDYGFPTGLDVLGANFEAHVFGFEARGEIARSTRYYQAPVAGGQRSKEQADTYYLQVGRQVTDGLKVGFETFDVPSDYSTSFSRFKLSNTGYTVGGRLYDQVDLVADNDDLDQWEDQVEHNDPLAPFASSLSSSGVGNGVFPGLDPDHDGVLDFNIDNGRGSDAFQPFLGYVAEPPELVYGDDFNNNGVADYRENDNLPDYLYPRDHKGHHAHAALELTGRTQVRAGWYAIDQPELGRRNNTRYLEGRYHRQWQGSGYLRVNQRFKWMQDDVPNTIYSPTVVTDPFARTYVLDHDLLQGRNSRNSLTYVEWGLTTIPALNVRNIVSLSLTDIDGAVPEDPLFTRPGTVTDLAAVTKADYTWRRGRLTLVPQFKHIYLLTDVPGRDVPERQRRWIMPILRADLQVGPRTVLKTGIQGLPLLQETVRDPANPEQSFERRTYTAYLQNRSNYQGYDLTILMGIYRTKQTYTKSTRPAFGSLEYFFRVYIG